MKRAIYKGEKIDVALRDQVVGRVSRATVVNPKTDEVIVSANELVSIEAAQKIEELGIDAVLVRSPLTSDSRTGSGTASMRPR
mgnify:CR=1 FL=1